MDDGLDKMHPIRLLLSAAGLLLGLALFGFAAWWIFRPGTAPRNEGAREPMTETPWLDGYSGQTTEELLALKGKYRTDSIILAFEQAMQQKAARVGQGKLTEEERIILAVESLEREVNNGGFLLFFVNSSGEYESIIVDALHRIGCPRTADLTRNAIAIVKKAPITADELAKKTWRNNEKRSQPLDECDQAYFGVPEDIEEKLFAFIKANRAKIQPDSRLSASRTCGRQSPKANSMIIPAGGGQRSVVRDRHAPHGPFVLHEAGNALARFQVPEA